MTAEFDVYFSGQCLPGFDPTDVVAGIARTFKLSPDAAQRLMDGTSHRIKAGCDKATALRYREVMASVGAHVKMVRQGTEAPDAAPTRSAPATPPHEIKAKVSGPAQFNQQASRVTHDPAMDTESDSTGDSIEWDPPTLATAPPPEAPAVELAAEPESPQALSLAPVGSILGAGAGAGSGDVSSGIAIPDYEVSEAGDMIPTLPDEREPVNPNTDHLRVVGE